MTEHQLVLLFDGTCGFCTRSTHWIRKRDKAGRVLALPNQTAGLIEQYGLTRADVDREVWLIDRDGRKWNGASAVNRVLVELGGGWAWLAKLYRLPPVRWLEERGYRWVAEHRSLLSRWWGTKPEWDADEHG